MKKKTQRVQLTIEVAALLLFAALLVTGRIQVWMALFLASLVLSLFFGRFYCGWICPIRTLQRPVSWLKKKLKWKSRPGPGWLRTPAVRFSLLGLFLIAMAFVLVRGRPLPVLPALLVIGVLISIPFSESLWHRWLCPYGTLLSFPGRLSQRRLIIQKSCIHCGICERVCPAEAVRVSEDSSLVPAQKVTARKTYKVEPSSCLLCLECSRQCPVQAIPYQKTP